MKFYKCNLCDNVFNEMDNFMCCDQIPHLLIANSVEASKEKHIPFYKIVNNRIEVSIGEIEHPMETEHYILWIAAVVDGKVEKITFQPYERPTATFNYNPETQLYCYCNLHGLWKIEI